MLSGWKVDSKRLGKRPENLGQDKAHDLFADDSPSEQDGNSWKRAQLSDNRSFRHQGVLTERDFDHGQGCGSEGRPRVRQLIEAVLELRVRLRNIRDIFCGIPVTEERSQHDGKNSNGIFETWTI
jgi:hypothetical protein